MARLKAKPKVKLSQTPKARSARRAVRREAAANDPAALTAPLTPKTLQTEIDASTRLKYGGQEKQIADQQRVSDEQQRRLGSWYDDYLNRFAATRASTAQGFQQAGQQIDQLAGTDTASSGSEDARKALSARQALIRSSAGTVAAQGANSNAYLADRERIGGLSKLQAQTGESNRKRMLGDQRRALEGEKGDYAVTLKRDARTSERNFGIANATLGLNQSKAATDAAAKKTDAKLKKVALKNTVSNTAADNALNDKKFASAAEKDAYQRKNHLGPYKLPAAKDPKAAKPLTDAQKRDRRKITTAKGQFEGPYKGNYRKYYDEGIAHGQEPALLHAGYELSKQGYIGSNTARQLRELGYTIPPKWRKRPGGPPSARATRGLPD